MQKLVGFSTILLATAALSAPALAQPAEPAETTAETPAAAEAPRAAPAQSAFVVVLNEGKRLSAQGKYYDAALVFNRILEEADETEQFFQEAEYELGVALYKLEFYVSAFGYFDRVVDTGSEHVRFQQTLPWLAKIHRKLPGEKNTLFRMVSYPAEAYPPTLADELNFYVGQYHYYEGNLSGALDNLARVGPSVPDMYARATYLKGVVHVRKNEAGPASEAFKEVLRFIKSHKDEVRSADRLSEMAIMALARIFYSTGQFDLAVKYYDQVNDDSEQWLDSLFEKSWAYFQNGNFARALGNIQTVNSPYFEEEFYPEAHVLKAVIFFKNCHYDEALETIDPFYKDYYTVMKELKAALEAHTDPADFYHYLASISARAGDYSLMVKKIFNAALADQRLRRLFGFVVHINREMNQLEELRKHPIAKVMVDFLVPDLVAYRALTMSEAGKLARERLLRVHKELKGLLSNALRVRFETLNAQKGILGSAFLSEQIMAKAGEVAEAVVDVEHYQWPFDGEFWKDELGSYYYPLKSLCIAK